MLGVVGVISCLASALAHNYDSAIRRLASLFGFRGIALVLTAILILTYLIHFYLCHRGPKRICQAACAGTLTHLKGHFDRVSARFQQSTPNRFNAVAEGCGSTLGVLVSLIIPEDSVPRENVLIFEFLFEANPKRAFGFYVQSKAPRFSEEMALQTYAVRDPALQCHTDLGSSRSLFLTQLESFMESHPKMLRLAALTDVGQFDLSQWSRHVVRLEFVFDRKSETFVLGPEIVQFALTLVATFDALELPGPEIEPILARRLRILKKCEQKGKKCNQHRTGAKKGKKCNQHRP
jgi:hypothetical protein